jgi:hypothetical protein
MATVNFSVPNEVKEAFDTAFKGHNKSAIVADLMREAVQRAERRRRHVDAIDRIVARHPRAPELSEAGFRVAREKGRP